MEHLAVSICKKTEIRGIPIGPIYHKLSLYEDYMLLYISNPRVAFPHILSKFTRFGVLNNLKGKLF